MAERQALREGFEREAARREAERKRNKKQLWLEILDQFDIRHEYVTFETRLGLRGNRQDAIDQHLRLIDAKIRAGYFFVRISELRQRLAAARQAELSSGGLRPSPEGQLLPMTPIIPIGTLRPEPRTLNACPSSDARRAKSTKC